MPFDLHLHSAIIYICILYMPSLSIITKDLQEIIRTLEVHIITIERENKRLRQQIRELHRLSMIN